MPKNDEINDLSIDVSFVSKQVLISLIKKKDLITMYSKNAITTVMQSQKHSQKSKKF
jgi:hypothetical protein